MSFFGIECAVALAYLASDWHNLLSAHLGPCHFMNNGNEFKKNSGPFAKWTKTHWKITGIRFSLILFVNIWLKYSLVFNTSHKVFPENCDMCNCSWPKLCCLYKNKQRLMRLAENMFKETTQSVRVKYKVSPL